MLVCPAFHPYVITALIPVIRRAYIHTHLLWRLEHPVLQHIFLFTSHKTPQRTGVFFLVAFFCNLWVSAWKLRTYHIRARRWSVKAVCGDAVCINHVCICRQAGRQAQRHHPSARAATPTTCTSTSRILPLRTEAATHRRCMHRHINHLKTKRRQLYLKTQSAPRCKNFSSRL